MYKTIVVHVSPVSGMPTTMAVAAGLAASHDAHLVGTAVTGWVELNGLMATGAPMVVMPALDIETLREEARDRLESFERQCFEFGVDSFESRLLDSTAVEALILQSRYCDLLVAGTQDVANYGVLAPSRLPGRLVTQCVRPVLLVPPAMRQPSGKFDKIMIAWNGSPGASRALGAALPLLQRASQVYIAVANPELERIDMGAEPGADLAAYLARHHRSAQVLGLDTTQETGSALCDLARHHHADLLVAGAYGHSRMHDWVLGSTTASLIEQSPVPLLMTQ
ncbi:universal stress protein [Pseudoduganella violaceinigra]|uniref:universal stress protein n=1 Tax=Pseudoduganella violaceinigra TaxID=246602 RepID=UPI00048623A8|nr:universal stress protein [Pseudoduganella violaceinigra]